MPKTKNSNELKLITDNYKAAVKWPTSPYQTYLGQLNEYVDELGNLVDRFWNNNLKQIVDPMVQDAEQDQLDSQLDQLEERMAAVFGIMAMRRKAQEMAQQVRQRAVLAFQDDMQKILGDQFTAGVNYSNLEPFVKQTIRRNVSLIKSIPAQYHDDIERIIYNGVRTGKPITAIQKQLDKALEKASGRTTTLAMDQVGSLKGSLTRRMHLDLGLEFFAWWGILDNKIREEHLQLASNGPFGEEAYRWSDPPHGKVPGEDPNCRCHAAPVPQEVRRKFAQQGVGAIAV